MNIGWQHQPRLPPTHASTDRGKLKPPHTKSPLNVEVKTRTVPHVHTVVRNLGEATNAPSLVFWWKTGLTVATVRPKTAHQRIAFDTIFFETDFHPHIFAVANHFVICCPRPSADQWTSNNEHMNEGRKEERNTWRNDWRIAWMHGCMATWLHDRVNPWMRERTKKRSNKGVREAGKEWMTAWMNARMHDCIKS